MDRRTQINYRSSRANQDNDWFFDKFDKHPVRSIVMAWVGLAVINLIFWGLAIIGILLAVKAIFF